MRMTETYERTRFLLPGCQRPSDQQLEDFWTQVTHTRDTSIGGWPTEFQVRWIGGDAATTRAILDHVRHGDKTGTVHVPEAVDFSEQPQPAVGDAVVLIDFDGTPELIVRITRIEIVAHANITERHTALDGPNIRELNLWSQIHDPYFAGLLAPAGLQLHDATPIAFETFELLYAVA